MNVCKNSAGSIGKSVARGRPPLMLRETKSFHLSNNVNKRRTEPGTAGLTRKIENTPF